MSAFRRWDPIWDINGAKWGVRIKGDVLPFPLPSSDCKSCGGNTPVPFCLKDYLPDKKWPFVQWQAQKLEWNIFKQKMRKSAWKQLESLQLCWWKSPAMASGWQWARWGCTSCTFKKINIWTGFPIKNGISKSLSPKYFCWKGVHLISPIIMLLTTLATML